MHRVILQLLPTILAVAAACGSVAAGDWPQILGPQRNGIAVGETITDSFPEGGPRTVWQREVGSGFAGVAVSAGKAVLFHRLGNAEVVEALDAQTGQRLWSARYRASYIPSYTSDNGPRAVPLIHKGRVFVYGAKGGLRSLDLKSGKKLWERDTFGDYNSGRPFRGEPPEGYFGIGTSPIVEAGKLIVNVGGDASGAGIVAFDLDSGKTIWKSTGERASYSSPIAATVEGTRHLLFATRLNVVSIDPSTGKVRFRIPFGHPGANVTAASPLVLDGHLFVTASYGIGAMYAKIGKRAADVLWTSDEILSSQYTTPIAHGRYLYGIHGRQDVGIAALRCIDPAAKRVVWSQEGFGYATLLKANGKLVILKTDGELILVRPDPSGYRELARAAVLETTTRALPALSNGLLYVRDTSTLKCLDLRRPK